MGWNWLQDSVVINIHDAQLAEHGGGAGLRDDGLLRSALARPRQRQAYGDGVDVADLAAAYAYGLARNHPFVDGNKRTAFVVMEVFLDLNGWVLLADDAACIAAMQDLAAGALTESELAQWLRRTIASAEPGEDQR